MLTEKAIHLQILTCPAVRLTIHFDGVNHQPHDEQGGGGLHPIDGIFLREVNGEGTTFLAEGKLVVVERIFIFQPAAFGQVASEGKDDLLEHTVF